MVRTKPASCSACICRDHGTDFSHVEGTGSSGVMLVGEASGEHEQRDQLPFRPFAPAGAVLTRIIQRMGLTREMFSITNVMRCRPRHNWLEGAPWEYSALNSCRPNLDAAIAKYQPRAIVALGGVALRELTGLAGEKLGITYLAGYPLSLMSRRPRAIRYTCGRCELKLEPTCAMCGGKGYYETQVNDGVPTDIPVIGDFHPAYLRRGKASHQGVFARILQRALNIAAGRDRQWLWGIDPDKKETYADLHYLTHPSTDNIRDYVARLRAHPEMVVSYDLETSESTSLDEDAREGFIDTGIRLAQFCFEPGRAIALDWERHREAARLILSLPNVKCGHNIWLFDDKVLRVHDSVPRGVRHDTLQMFHHWQPDLPAHLQFAASFVQFPFPWKHLAGSDLEFYGCCDVDATLRLYNFLRAQLERDGLWHGYISQVYEVRPVLAAMEDRGMPIDDAARVRLGMEFEIAQAALGKVLAERVPEGCQRVEPFKTNPPEVREWLAERGLKLGTKSEVGAHCMIAGDWQLVQSLMSERFKEKDKIVKDGTVEEGEWYVYQRRKFETSLPIVDSTTGEPALATTTSEQWCRVYDFNPNSPAQMLAYIKSKGHKVPKSKEEDDEGNQKDTTAAKELLRLAARTGDDFYIKVVEYRGYTKLRGTYVDGFKPGADGRVHTTFTFDTAIAQLSSRNPNTQNFTKLKPTPELAMAMRSMVAADEGCVLAEIDFKSCHVITLGYLAGDPTYTRLGRLDIHSFVAGHFLGLWDGRAIIHESDAELLARFKWLKSNPEWKLVRDDQAKHGILGIGNGLRGKGLFERYMENFPPRKCDACVGTGRVQGARGLKHCPVCKGTGTVPGQRVADAVIDTCELLFDRIFKYQEAQRHEAHERRELRTAYGHMRRFYEVLRPDPRRGGLTHGDQAEEAVAYRLANVAHAHMREVMKAIHAKRLDEKYGLFNVIHDSLMFHFPESQLEAFACEVPPVMTAESTVYPGLWMGAEASYGKRWSDMQNLEVPKALTAEVGT